LLEEPAVSTEEALEPPRREKQRLHSVPAGRLSPKGKSAPATVPWGASSRAKKLSSGERVDGAVGQSMSEGAGCLDFRLLGPVEVRNGDVLLALGGRKQRALVTLLAMSPGDVVSVDRLVDEIWGGVPPPSAQRTLQAYVSRLRAVLETLPWRSAPASVLVSRDPGYVLAIDKDQVDSHRFETLVGEASQLISQGRPEAAAGCLRHALDLWRGPALGEFAYENFAVAESLRLNERRLEAVELRIDAELVLGRHDDLVGELSGLVVQNPLRERFWGQLMVALYRCGRQAEALDAYKRLRRNLVEDLGIEPASDLRRLERLILEQAPEIDGRRSRPTLGLSQPVSEPSRPGRDEASVPLVPPMAPDKESLCVGRAKESANLYRLFEEVAQGSQCVAFVTGEPGIGKTVLMAALAREAAGAGATVLYGRCDEDLGAPYQPFVEALTHYVAHGPTGVLADNVAEHGGELLHLVPSLARRLPECPAPRATDPDAERYLAFGAVAGLIRRASNESPLVILLDDLHWAEKGTLLLLRYLAAKTKGHPVFFVCTYRSSVLSENLLLTDAIASLRRDVAVETLELRGLVAEDVVEIAESIGGRPLDADGRALARSVHLRTAGNPFFAVELLRHLMCASDPRRREVPESVQIAVSQRVQRLGEPARTVLMTAAVFGMEFELELLKSVLGASDEPVGFVAGKDLLVVLERCVAAALIVEQDAGHFAFSHSMIQQSLYESVGSTRRMKIHGRIARVIESSDGKEHRARTLAHHWHRADDWARSLPYMTEAGQAALDALDPDEAIRWFEEGLRIQARCRPHDSEMRSELLILLGTAQHSVGDSRYRRTLLEAGALARSLDDGARMARAALASYRGLWSAAGRIDVEQVEALDAALQHSGHRDSGERARMMATLASELNFSQSVDRRRALMHEAKEMAGRLDDPATTLWVLTSIGDTWGPAAAEERLADSQIALKMADRIEDPVAKFYAYRFRLQAAFAVGRVEECDDCLTRLQELSTEIGQPTLRWITAFSRSCRALLAGDPGEAERLAEEAFEIGTESGQPDALDFFGAGIAHVRWQQGRLAKLMPLFLKALDDNPDVPAYKAAVAWAASESDDPGMALDLLEDGVAKSFAHLPDDSLQLPSLVMYSEAAIRLGSLDAARVLCELLGPWEAQITYMGVATEGPVTHYLGGLETVVGRFDTAARHLERARRVSRAVGARFFAARAELALAELLVKRGRRPDVTRAQALLDRVGRTAAQSGYAGVERRVSLVRAGVRA
jgi:DNA-binding SARP family transcriptional activator/tetratricopeptide (TPR) repeat protein